MQNVDSYQLRDTGIKNYQPICYLLESHSTYNYISELKVKEWEKI